MCFTLQFQNIGHEVGERFTERLHPQINTWNNNGVKLTDTDIHLCLCLFSPVCRSDIKCGCFPLVSKVLIDKKLIIDSLEPFFIYICWCCEIASWNLEYTRSKDYYKFHPYLTVITDNMKRNLTFRHRASCILGQAFHYSPENAFYIFNQQIYFIIWYLLDRSSLI